jgi:hypothetical protein
LKIRIQSKRETKKPDRGIVVEYVTMLNQRNEVVGEGEHGLMVYRGQSVKSPVAQSPICRIATT